MLNIGANLQLTAIALIAFNSEVVYTVLIQLITAFQNIVCVFGMRVKTNVISCSHSSVVAQSSAHMCRSNAFSMRFANN